MALLSASIPLLLGISNFTQDTFYGEDVYVISQVTNDKPIKMDLAERLRNESWIDGVSPEVYAFCIVKGNPVVVRGVEPDSFLEIEGAEVVQGIVGEDFLLVGEALGNRLDFVIGEKVVLTGSTNPKVSELEVTGVFRSGGPSNDELLVPLEQGWIISPVGRDHVLSIRVKTHEYGRLRSYLNETGIPLVLGDGVNSEVLNSEEKFDARLVTLLFQHPELGGERGIAHTSVFVQQAGNSIRIVVVAFIVLNSSLILLGMLAILSKALIEKKRDMGILSAIGATKGRMRAFILSDLLKISLLSAFIGVVVGFLVAYLVGSTGVLLLFGHGVQPAFGVEVVLGMFLLGLLLPLVLGLVIYEFVHRKRPMTLIRRIETDIVKERSLEEVLSE